MRRITIFTDEETAQKVVPWLEQQGVDFMSEDFAEPSLARRSPPIRRPQPERHEASPGILKPLRTPLGRTSLRSLREYILKVVGEAGTISRKALFVDAQNRGWLEKSVRDTARRMVKSGHLLGLGSGGIVDRYTLPSE